MTDDSDGRRRPGTDERGRQLSETTRVEAFSDGVLAIVITLLVLDLRDPAHAGGQLLHGLLQEWPAYVAYLASFVYVGVIWVNHHQLFSRIASADGKLLWINVGLLLATSVLPFPTAVLGDAIRAGNRADERTAIVFYALVSAAMAFSWLIMFWYLDVRHAVLVAEGTPAAFFRQERRRALLGISSYLVAALVSVAEPTAALILLAVVPVFYAATSEGWVRRKAA